MPVWTPGSYMVREFSRHIDMFKAINQEGKSLSWSKTSKNQWQIQTGGADTVVISYRVYANELTVRTSLVNDEHAMLNGASVMMGVEELLNQAHQVHVQPYAGWKSISTSLSAMDNPWVRKASNYDEIVDSPIELGNQQVIDFNVGDVPHQLVMIGSSNADTNILVNDLKKIIETEVSMFGKEHPCDRYVFFLSNTESARGGLEHSFSSYNMVPRWHYGQRDQYLQIVSLLAHEYFHLWNIKRIRPVELGPFDYHQENYTRQLWLIEGITSYYDDYFVYRSGVSAKQEYLNIVAENLGKVVNQPGDGFQSLAESSFDTWIKYYRQHENSHNNQVNYYTKGAVVSMALNFLIMDATNGKRSLDDVMKLLYESYLKRPAQGFSEAEVLALFEQVAGVSLKSFFDQHIYGTVPVDYAAYFKLLGLNLKDTRDQDALYLGWTLSVKENRWMVTKVDAGYGAYNAGISAEDEILAINGYRMHQGWEKMLAHLKTGEKVDVLISRGGIIRTVQMELTADKRVRYKLEEIAQPTERQLLLRNLWLGR